MTQQSFGDQKASEQNRRYGIWEGAYCAVMQAAEAYLSAFALLLHASSFQVGLLAALPQFVGTFSQLLSVKMLNWFNDRKRLIVLGAAGQAILWVPLLALPILLPEYGPWLLIACAVLYFATGHVTIPAWNSLIADLIDPNQRGAYFACRAKIMAVTSFTALSGGGLILQVTEPWEAPWAGFALIFLVAACARAISAWYLAHLIDSGIAATQESTLRLSGLAQGDDRSSHFRRFLLFSGLMHLAAFIAGPYFVIYLFRDLQFTYLQYSCWGAAPIIGQVLTLSGWGRIGDAFGNRKLLLVTGLLIPFIPMLYLFSTEFLFLILINLVAGATWSGFALGLQNTVFDLVRAEDRPKGVAIYNAVNALASSLGALLGSWLVLVMPSAIVLPGLVLQFPSNLPIVFLMSGGLRLAVSLSLLKAIRKGRAVVAISRQELFQELPLIKPLMHAVFGRISRQF